MKTTITNFKKILCASIILVVLVAAVSCAFVSEAEETPKKKFRYSSYKELPGITDAEIAEIEVLKKKETVLLMP